MKFGRKVSLCQFRPDENKNEVFTFIDLLKACAKRKDLQKGIDLHTDIRNKGLLESSPYVGSTLVSMYAKCGLLSKAQEVFDELPIRDLVSWSALISGYAQKGQGHEALKCFEQMQKEGVHPNAITFSSILKACGSIRAIEIGKQVHDEVVARGLLKDDVVLGNALVDMYTKCGALAKAKEVVDQLPVRDVVSWCTLITGYAQQGQGHEALKCFEQMRREGLSPDAVTFTCALQACGSVGAIDMGEQIHDEILNKGLLKNNLVLASALVDMYVKCQMLGKAEQLHDELPLRNIVSWNALVAGYAQEGQSHEAVGCLEHMRREGLFPDAVTFSCILKVCGSKGAIDKGTMIHDEIVSRGLLDEDIMLGNALVDMYAKCGMLSKASNVLKDMPYRNTVSWSTLITGHAHQGQHHEAVQCFRQMQNEGIPPNSVTMLCVLMACGNAGFVDEAEMYFKKMRSYGLKPSVEHITCMVDVFGCAGHFDKAMSLIKRMKCSDYPPVWLAILSACRKWGNVKLGRFAFDHAVQLESENPVQYILMANIYADADMQEDAEKVEAMRVKHAFIKDNM